MSFGGSNSGDAATQLYNQQQGAITQGLGQLNQTFSGFTPQFYQQRAQDYTNFAMPQLNQQYQQNQQGLQSNLANQGILNSSAAQSLSSQLGGQYRLGQQNILNQGQQQAQQLQSNVANTQAQLTNQLTQSANPSSVAGAAVNAASQYSAPSAFAPIGNLFSQWGNIYAANSLSNNGTTAASPYSLSRPNTNTGANTSTTLQG
jgi:hypothetical protein